MGHRFESDRRLHDLEEDRKHCGLLLFFSAKERWKRYRTHVRMRERATEECRRKSCSKLLKRSALVYCSVRCQKQYEYEQYIEKWLSGEVDGSTSGGEVI